MSAERPHWKRDFEGRAEGACPRCENYYENGKSFGFSIKLKCGI